ncbi:Outer membrane protein beta-barrel domain-containing protein [Chitinophaga eiseniae]|uniref:Outer membrane protein beta-barrel domain-containing protein n=1 Tax=Chitinophaga eiseniae TaxID=634771 RepID=A0A1T4KR07_9BACT|nr:outer membrane beta-barrel protein [Chitinophaga eiseniae]SJZ44851.1 Outer membrane protein beta-barrel domain-containing protein [Chitinophaga eiseniae]
MKKIRLLTLVAVSVLMGSTVKAQIQKGNIMVGASLTNLNVTFQKESTAFGANITPKIGWFIKDGLAIGGYVNFGANTTKNKTTDIRASNTNYGVGAFARYFVEDKNVRKLEFSKRVRFFAEANAGFAGQNPASGASTNGFNVGIGPGISYFITPNVGLEGLLKYDLTVGGGNSTTANNLSLGIGFQIYLPSAKAKAIYREERGGK